MALSFKCKCGAPLRAAEEQAGQRLQCPTCGRVVVVPAPAASLAESDTGSWKIDISEGAAARAEQAGVIRRGRAGVIRLHASHPLTQDLTIEGVFNCWHCRLDNPFTGQVFGRPGLGGALADVSCRKCHAGIRVSFSSHAAGQASEVILWAPSHTRDYDFSGNDPLPAPSFRITSIVEVSVGKSPEVHKLLPALIQCVQGKLPYKDAGPRAGDLVTLRLPEAHREVVCKAMRMLLEKDQPTYLKTVLVEALACFRDETAAEMVQYALQQSLAEEDPKDPNNLPLHDLCVLALLFGDKNGFKNALDLGFKKLPITTRAFRWDKPLTPDELADLMKQNTSIDSYESALGGAAWQRVQPLLPLEEEIRKGAGSRWLKKFFGK